VPGVAADGVGHARIQLDHIDSNAIASNAVEQMPAEITTNRKTLSCPKNRGKPAETFFRQSPAHARVCASNAPMLDAMT
jgi:hypothetical protein